MAFRPIEIDCNCSAVRVELPLLILPLAGIKRLELGMRQEEILPKKVLMIHHTACLQLGNLPPAA